MSVLEFNKDLLGMENIMRKFALSLSSDRENAKDLVQDTYLKAFTNMDKYIELTNLKAWTFTIMKNTFINKYRRSVRENIVLDNTEDQFLLNDLRDSGFARPDSEFAYDEIIKIINSLEDNFKIPFRMHVEGYKYKEIAEIINLNIGTVKSRIFFARKKLKEILHDSK